MCLRFGDVAVRELVQFTAGFTEQTQQSHQECRQDRAQLISFSSCVCVCVCVGVGVGVGVHEGARARVCARA